MLIITGGNADGSGFSSMYKSSLFVGTSSTNISNVECAYDIGETGFYQCKGAGRYLFLKAKATATL